MGKVKRIMWKVADGLCNLVLLAGGLIALWLVLQVTTYASFKVPTDSMQPTLIPGDYILVNKWVMGGRVFNVWKSLERKEVRIWRLPGLRRAERGDVLVFNFPYPVRPDSISMDIMKYYVKRCVALPGDTFEIRRARYTVRGYAKPLGNVEAQDQLQQMLEWGQGERIVLKGYPYNELFDWSIQEFGPLYVPAKGDSIEMNVGHVALYKNLIEWEQKKPLVVRGDSVWLNDSLITGYRFRENYYFMAGDRVVNSQDSRYWGLVPEPYIVGKATRIWKSADPWTEEIRWERVMKAIGD